MTTPTRPHPAAAEPEPDLMILAYYIDHARLRANSVESAASQDGVYGDLSRALVKTLALIVGENQAEAAYQALLDGSSVTDALKHARDSSPAHSPITESEVLP